MADRYQDRFFSTDADHNRGANPDLRAESDRLPELALIENDPFGTPAKFPLLLLSRANIRPRYAGAEEEASAPAGPPPQEASPQKEYEQLEPEYQHYPGHPLNRYASVRAAASEQNDHESQQDSVERPVDSSRDEDALYGPITFVEQEKAGEPAYSDDLYAYRRGYNPEPRKRSSGMVTAAVVLALVAVGTGATFYRTYVGSPRSGEPPIIRADNSPTKVAPARAESGASKIPDRMPPGGGGEKLVSREEAPVDIDPRSGAASVVFPPLNQNTSAAADGMIPNEPRKVKALTVKGDAAENGGTGSAAPAKPDAAARSASGPTAAAKRNLSAANANANAPPSPSPQSASASDPAPPTLLAAANVVQTAPSAGGGYLVQVSSQKNEVEAHASYRTLQNKFPAALGSRPPVIKRADLGQKGVYYRTLVGPFGSTDEAAQFCSKLKSAGGQCVIQKN